MDDDRAELAGSASARVKRVYARTVPEEHPAPRLGEPVSQIEYGDPAGERERPFGHADRLEYVNTCPRCRQAPAGHPKPAGLCDQCFADVVQRAIVAIRAAVFVAMQPPERDCCEACGCLVLPDEHCPGCKARRQAAAEQLHRPVEAA